MFCGEWCIGRIYENRSGLRDQRWFWVSRDYLDENGGGQSEFEAAAGSEVMIGLGPEVRKHFFWVSVFDCR